jgi:AcrR family transcriptional regulator
MKISEKQKTANRKKILDAAVELMSDEGIDKVSMRRIAKAAGMGEATIYNYFATKEKLLAAYFLRRSDDVVAALKTVDGWERFTFGEQLLTMIDTWLARFADDRTFVVEAFPRVFLRPAALTGEAIDVRAAYLAMIGDLLEAAVEVGELPPSADAPLVRALTWDYFVGVVSYWIRDTSDRFDNTTQLVDKSVRLAESLLKTRIIDHGLELITFLFRSHVVAPFESATRMFDDSPLKRAFFGWKKE